MKIAGVRKSAPVRYRPSLPGSESGGGAATTGGSAVIPPTPNELLLVRGLRRRFELRLDAGDVARVLEELLEQPPLTLARRRSERRRLVVGHVEHDRLRRQDRGLARAGDRVGIDARRHVVVAGPEPALLRPRLGGLRRREE